MSKMQIIITPNPNTKDVKIELEAATATAEGVAYITALSELIRKQFSSNDDIARVIARAITCRLYIVGAQGINKHTICEDEDEDENIVYEYDEDEDNE
ncbi:MAG: hypothetical protein [Bacteriophage sp.]|nr:MAG: hypothetical protein [Bacteriophage sp.]